MKLLTIITHPFVVITLFYLILVSGEHIGGPYALYILLALPHGGVHAVLALLGTGLILLSYGKFHRQHKYLLEPLLNVFGVGSLLLSLYTFFVRSKGYNDGTFDQAVPLVSLALFGLAAIGFLLYSMIGYVKLKRDQSSFAL